MGCVGYGFFKQRGNCMKTCLFTDLDGTLLDNNGIVSDENKAAIKCAIDNGKRVIICSGRNWRSLEYYEKMLGLDSLGFFGVAYNGGAIYANKGDSKEFLYRKMLDKYIAFDLLVDLKQRLESDMHILVYANEDRLIAEERVFSTEVYARYRNLDIIFIDDFLQIQTDFGKILLYGSFEKLEKARIEMIPKYKGRANIFFSAHDLLELGPLGVNKGNAIKFLSDYMNIPLDEIIAIGDEANDIEMLKTAGLGLAVANATEAAKQAADIIMEESNIQSAVSAAIYKYLLV